MSSLQIDSLMPGGDKISCILKKNLKLLSMGFFKYYDLLLQSDIEKKILKHTYRVVFKIYKALVCC